MLLYPNAKINIGLYVTQKRPDGFHNLETVFYPIPLCDILELNPLSDKWGTCEFKESGISLDCADDANLVVRAYHLLDNDFSLPAVSVHLHKQIPFGAGLGGGSSDAAFMLKGLNELFHLNLSVTQLERYASQLGSDCAFFINNQPSFASGKGEVLEPLAMTLKNWLLVLVKPNCHVSTAQAYKGVRPKATDIDLHTLIDLPITQWSDKVKNDFENSIFQSHPQIEAIKSELYRLGATYASMSGSGATVFGLFPASTDIHFSSCFSDCFVWSKLLV